MNKIFFFALLILNLSSYALNDTIVCEDGDTTVKFWAYEPEWTRVTIIENGETVLDQAFDSFKEFDFEADAEGVYSNSSEIAFQFVGIVDDEVLAFENSFVLVGKNFDLSGQDCDLE